MDLPSCCKLIIGHLPNPITVHLWQKIPSFTIRRQYFQQIKKTPVQRCIQAHGPIATNQLANLWLACDATTNPYALVYVIASKAGITKEYLATILSQHVDTAKHFCIRSSTGFYEHKVAAEINTFICIQYCLHYRRTVIKWKCQLLNVNKHTHSGLFKEDPIVCSFRSQTLIQTHITPHCFSCWAFLCFLPDRVCFSSGCLLLISARALCGGL